MGVVEVVPPCDLGACLVPALEEVVPDVVADEGLEVAVPGVLAAATADSVVFVEFTRVPFLVLPFAVDGFFSNTFEVIGFFLGGVTRKQTESGPCCLLLPKGTASSVPQGF